MSNYISYLKDLVNIKNILPNETQPPPPLSHVVQIP